MRTPAHITDQQYLPDSPEEAWRLVVARAEAAITTLTTNVANDPSALHHPIPPADLGVSADAYRLLIAARCAGLLGRSNRCEEHVDAIHMRGGQPGETALQPEQVAWARGQITHATLDACLARALHAGHLTLGAANNLASLCWDRDRPDLVRGISLPVSDLARGAGDPSGPLWGRPAAWSQMDAREVCAPEDLTEDDHQAALVLWQALVAGETERYAGDVQPSGESMLAPTPYQDPVFFAAHGQLRLACARAALGVDRTSAQARGAWMWRRHAGGPDDDPWEFGHLVPLDTPAEFRARARHQVFAPTAYGDATPGREVIVPVSGECVSRLWSEHRDDPACEGLRVMLLPGDPVRARRLALTLAHTDADGPRRVSAAWADHAAPETPEQIAVRLGGKIVGEFTWDRTSFFADTGAPGVPARPDVLGPVNCPHPRREWAETFFENILEQRCAVCRMPLVRAHRHQLTPTPADLDVEDAVRWARTWAALNGEDPAGVPTSILALRARDGQVPVYLRPSHAAPQSLRAQLAGYRGGKDRS